MMRHASNHGDPYDYPYREAYYGRDYRDHYGHRESYWDPLEYTHPSHHRDYAREPGLRRESAAPRVPVKASPAESPMIRAVGNITNSDDFASKDSRLFVGNLNTLLLTKDDVHGIFGRMGTVTGISMHKGYAFVQFCSPGEARRALALENGQTYAGQALDLNIVSQPKIKGAPKRSPDVPGHDGLKKTEENPAMGPAAKRPRPEGFNPSMQRGNLVTLANSDHLPSGVPRQGRGPWREEPEEVGCSQCSAVFTSAWSLCLHAQQRHNVTIFRTTLNNSR